jgi:hypothetical protein
MNWQRLADTNWTNARVKQWTVAAMVYNRLDLSRVKFVGKDTATKLRGAWIMLTFLRQYEPAKARQLRHEYGYSRFYEVYKKWQAYEMSPDECIEYIESDLSNTAMACQIEDMHDPKPEWERNAFTIYGKVTKLVQVSYDAPEWFRDWASETERLFKEKGIK